MSFGIYKYINIQNLNAWNHCQSLLEVIWFEITAYEIPNEIQKQVILLIKF